MTREHTYDAVVVGGGPAGATAAADLALKGWSVLLLDQAGRIKPCGGAVPPALIREFGIPDSLLCARVDTARVIAPSGRNVDMPIGDGYVGMVDRGDFDEWLRQRAVHRGAERRTGKFVFLAHDNDGTPLVKYAADGDKSNLHEVRCRVVIGADGANSAVAQQAIPEKAEQPFVFAYHEIIDTEGVAGADYGAERCDVYYQGKLSPDFYAWVFPHGGTASIGVGSARKGFALRGAVAELRRTTGLDGQATVRSEGAPIPLKTLPRWDNGRDVILAGDAAGMVAPASGEGIYYAMLGGRLASDAVDECLRTADGRALASARRRFMKQHGKIFWMLGMMQKYWYQTERRRERFVNICADPDVQYLTWKAYMDKELVRARPMAHLRIFLKDMAHLFGLVTP